MHNELQRVKIENYIGSSLIQKSHLTPGPLYWGGEFTAVSFVTSFALKQK